jgi:hypothetical protein
MARNTKQVAEQAPTNTVQVSIDGKNVNVPTDESMREQGMDTLSARIRHLSGLGVPTAGIAKIVKRANGQHPLYQHVRNVLNTPLKAVTPETNEAPAAE